MATLTSMGPDPSTCDAEVACRMAGCGWLAAVRLQPTAEERLPRGHSLPMLSRRLLLKIGPALTSHPAVEGHEHDGERPRHAECENANGYRTVMRKA